MWLKKRILSFKYAFNGLAFLIKTQPNAQIHFVAILMVIFLGGYFGLNQTEWIAITFCVTLVLGSEIINTAIEKLCNFVEPNQHVNIKIIKDLSAAAVLICAIASVIVGLIIFLPKLGF